MPPTQPPAPFPQNMQEICGALHLHTTISDGGVNYDELIGAARSPGLQYIVVTDHMSMGGALEGFEGQHGALSVVVGYEHHDRHNKNHYLAIGASRVYMEFRDAPDYVAAVRKDGGVGFVAHPAEKRNYFGNLPPYPWTEWNLTEFDGIELWNQMSDWMEHLRSWFSFIRLFYPRRFMANAPSELLRRWDQLNSQRFVSGVGGVDAHTRRLGSGFLYLTVFPIRVELQGIRTHLYVRSPFPSHRFADSKQTIMEALRDGRGSISNFRRGDARGTRIWIAYEKGGAQVPGRQERARTPATICVDLPERADIRLIADSAVTKQESSTATARFRIDSPAVYRIEVYKGKHAWIYSNPFTIWD